MGTLRGIFLDKDGAIIDRARTPHVVQRDFQGVQLPRRLGIDEYKRLLQIAGGKERMKKFPDTRRVGRPVGPEEVDDLIAPMQRPKTAALIDRVKSGRMSLRPGIHLFLRGAAGLRPRLAVDTTSREKEVHAIP